MPKQYGRANQGNVMNACHMVMESGRAAESVAKLLASMWPLAKPSEEFGCLTMRISRKKLAARAFGNQEKQARRALDAALSTGLLVIVQPAAKGRATVYAFKSDFDNRETQTQEEVSPEIRGQLEADKGTVQDESGDSSQCGKGPSSDKPSSDKPSSGKYEGGKKEGKKNTAQDFDVAAYLAEHVYPEPDERIAEEIEGYLDSIGWTYKGQPIKRPDLFIKKYFNHHYGGRGFIFDGEPLESDLEEERKQFEALTEGIEDLWNGKPSY